MKRTTGLYQVYDTKAESAAGPIMSVNKEAAAIRHFTSILELKDTMPGKYPGDYELRYLGEQEEETGEIHPIKPTTIITGGEWFHSKQRERGTAALMQASLHENGG